MNANNTTITLLSVAPRVAYVAPYDVSTCRDYIRYNTKHECFNLALSVLDFVTYMIFQGMSNTVYIDTNYTTDITLKGPIVAMIEKNEIDTMSSYWLAGKLAHGLCQNNDSHPLGRLTFARYTWRAINVERLNRYSMSTPFGAYHVGMVWRAGTRQQSRWEFTFGSLLARIHWSVYALLLLCCCVFTVIRCVAARVHRRAGNVCLSDILVENYIHFE
jgi:hypothetical protein